jgi:hypothetical protein
MNMFVTLVAAVPALAAALPMLVSVGAASCASLRQKFDQESRTGRNRQRDDF